MGIKIIGTGSYAPEKILTNHDLAEMVDSSDEWIRTRTGIKERHIAADDESASDLAYKACQKALQKANVSVEEIDLIVVASITGDRPTPSTACILQRKLKAYQAACFDLLAACTGFLYSIEVANAMMKNNPKYRKTLVVGVEKLSSVTDWEDRNTCVLFGDGAGVVVLEQRIDKFDIGGVIGCRLGSNGDHSDILQIPGGGSENPASHETVDQHQHYLQMAGQEVFKLAVNGMSNACLEVLENAGISVDDIRWLIPHQANLRIISAVGKRVKIPSEKVFVNLQKYGNTSAASVAIALDEIVQNGLVERGDFLLLTAFGAGLTWGASLLRW